MPLEPKEIVDALPHDPYIRTQADIKQMTMAAGKLVEIIGKRCDKPINFAELNEMMLELIEHILQHNSKSKSELDLTATIEVLRFYKGRFNEYMADEDLTDAEAIRQMQLGRDLYKLYERGELTYAVLARNRPSAFLGR